MSRSTSVSRNGVGNAAMAARSCSASAFAMSAASGVSPFGSLGLACSSLDRLEIFDRNDRGWTILAEP